MRKTLLIALLGAPLLTPGLQAGFLDSLLGVPQISDVYVSPDFPGIHAPGARIAVIGVANRGEERIYSEQRIELSQLVASAVHRKNRDIQIESAEGLVRALGEEAVTDLLNFFERNGDLDLTHLNAIEAGYPAATHVLAVRIDRNHVDQSTSRMSYDNKDKPKAKAHYDANGKLVLDNFAMGSETVTAVDTYTTSRDLAILVEIFDVAKGITVWSGHVHKRHSTNATQQNQYSANHHDRFKEELSQALAKGIVSGLTGTKVNNYPEPISTQDLLGELLITFGQKLP